MAIEESIDRTGKMVAAGVFLAMLVDGMDFQALALSLPAISRELHLSTVGAGALSTYTFLGMGLGGILAGWLADRIGRVRVVWWSVLTFSAFTGVIAVCHTFWQITGMRFVSGLGLGALYSVGTVLVAEYVPMRRRSTVLGILQAAYSTGYVTAALLSSWLIPAFGWRALFGCAILPGIVTLFILWEAPDPPNWSPAVSRGTFATIATIAPVRRTFLLWTMASFALQFGYYGANTWLPSYLARDMGISTRNVGWYVAGTYTMAILGKVVTGHLGDRLGRRITWVLSGVLTALYLPVLIHVATVGNVALLLLLFGVLFGAPYAIYATYISESFPAEVRGTAVASSYAIGRLGSMVSPLLIGITASRYAIGPSIGLLGVSYAICALVPAIFIPEKAFDPKATAPIARQTSAAKAATRGL